MSLKVNKLNFGGSTIDNITWGETQVMCLKWGTEIVWEKEVPKQYIRFEPKTANDFAKEDSIGASFIKYQENLAKDIMSKLNLQQAKNIYKK